MKKMILLTILTAGSVVRAGTSNFSCSNNEITLVSSEVVNSNSYSTSNLKIVDVASGCSQNQKVFVTFTKSGLFEQTNFESYSVDRSGGPLVKLTVSKSQILGRGGCGRAGCNNGQTNIHGKLVLDGVESQLACDEI